MQSVGPRKITRGNAARGRVPVCHDGLRVVAGDTCMAGFFVREEDAFFLCLFGAAPRNWLPDLQGGSEFFGRRSGLVSGQGPK